MVILTISILILLMVLMVLRMRKTKNKGDAFVLSLFIYLFILISILIIFFNLGRIKRICRPEVIDQQIQMIQEENDELIETMNNILSQGIEKDDLQEVIKVYSSNEEKILKLKEEKINLSYDRFLLFFGN